ncbi:MAG: heterodisulfide reductase-related iron-sulfur binding cluster [Opitutaceae bacterium]
MLHSIKPEKAGRHAPDMSRAVEACVHCGFCLPTCPTYAALGEEMDSPRGRIFLMKEALEGHLAPDEARPFIDNCLGCLACETSCPSGVRYGELLTPYRAWSQERLSRRPADRLRRKLLLAVLPYPARFRAVARLGRIAKPFARWLPGTLRPMLGLVPDRLPSAERLPAIAPAHGPRRARVALLSGCAQQVLAPSINRATLEVLAANGVEVAIPGAQGCCGALALHVGEESAAMDAARRNLAAFPRDVDAIVTNAAGCGSGLREYGLLFRGTAMEAEAQAFAGRVCDVSVFLDRLGLIAPTAPPAAIRVAYHDACHLAHAQGVRQAPRRLLSAISGLQLVEPAEWELCCGSAGSYNLEHPETAAILGRRKAANLIASGAEAVATGNIGCLTQIQWHLQALGARIPVRHTLEFLADAYRAC